MINEILIENSKLRLRKLKNQSLGDSIKLVGKSTYRYQFILVVDKQASGNPWSMISSKGIYSLTQTWNSNNYNAWVIERTSIKNAEKIDYTGEEIKVIAGFISVLWGEGYIPFCEKLCRITKDEKLVKLFYSSYSKSNGLLHYLISLNNNKNYVSKNNYIETTPLTYGRPRYSVYKLLLDLEKEHADILVDDEVVGKYSRISRSKTSSSGRLSYPNGGWCNVVGLLGNKERANVSLYYKSSITIVIPKNQVGVSDGKKNYNVNRVLNVIKDGTLNMKYLGVRVGKSLREKLKRVGCVYSDLLYDTDLLIDLKKLPVICRSDLRDTTSLGLASLVKDLNLEKAAIEYYKKLIKPMESDKDLFLRGLSIINNTYSPKLKIEKEGFTYTSMALKSRIYGLPTNTQDIRTCIDDVVGKKKYTGKNRSIINCITFLKSLPVGPDNNVHLEEHRKKFNVLNIDCRKRTFEMIMSKKLRFKQKHSPVITGLRQVVTDWKLATQVNVSWNIKELTINI